MKEELTQKLAAENEATTLKIQIKNLNELLRKYEFIISSQQNSLNECMIYEEGLVNQIKKIYEKLNTFISAFDQLKKKYIEIKILNEESILNHGEEVLKLRRIVQAYSPLSNTKWDETSPVVGLRDNLLLQTEKLKSRNFLISYVLLNVEKQFLYTSRFSILSFPESSVYQFGITTLRLVYKVDSILQHIYVSDYKSLISDLQSNPSSVSKNRSYVLWLHQTVTILCTIQWLLSEILETLRKMSFDQVLNLFVEKRTTNTQNSLFLDIIPIKNLKPSGWINLLKIGEHYIDELIGLAVHMVLAPSYDTSVLEEFISNMEKLLSLARESNNETMDDNISTFCYTSSQAKGIQPPVIVALLRRLNSVAVVGYSGASYDSSLLKEIPTSVWAAVWEATDYLINKIPFGSAFKEENISPISEKNVISLGFGYFIMKNTTSQYKNAANFLNSMTESINYLESVLVSPSDAKKLFDGPKIIEEARLVGLNLKFLDEMCTDFYTDVNDFSNPWETAIERVVEHLQKTKLVTEKLVDIQNECQQKKETINKLHQDIEDLERSSLEWSQKYGVANRELRRFMHLEYELQEKNAREHYLSTTLMTQQQNVKELQEEKNILLEEVTHLQSKLQKMTQFLKRFKNSPYHLDNTSDWMPIEIAHLRLINQKLHKELLSLEVAKANLAARIPFAQIKNESKENNDSYLTRKELAKNPLEIQISKNTLIKEYLTLRRLIMGHMINTPLYDPKLSTTEWNIKQKEYGKVKANLFAQFQAFKIKLESCLRQATRRLSESYGEFGPNSLTNRYEWMGLCNIHNMQKNTSWAKPTMKITIPRPPEWADVNGFSKSCKFVLNSHQLGLLHKKTIINHF
ncbi:uncharacterized protein LOC128883603 isoform X2 [Hylaeus volcanicus]|nr:uncharacterized protein LOC128883603 isoform X2 [Hylaeus volcanicus]XP_053992115.1 uncharacterized protein LOC128883603 isoform X2 [Hylaeus volcanicus]